MSPRTRVATDPPDAFVAYDDLVGPDLDPARWSPVRLPLPTGEPAPLDPGAQLTVTDGTVRVTIPRFSVSHDTFQAADSAKYLLVSTGRFELPPDRPVTFAVDLAVENVGGEPADYRLGMAAFQVVDLDGTQRAFSVCGTSTRVLALHEHVSAGSGGDGRPFYHVVESPYEDFDDDFTRFRVCEITLDRGTSTAIWRVDGRTVYETRGTVIPERARIAFGIWTMVAIRAGRSRALHGQGLDARWRRPRVLGADASALPPAPGGAHLAPLATARRARRTADPSTRLEPS